MPQRLTLLALALALALAAGACDDTAILPPLADIEVGNTDTAPELSDLSEVELPHHDLDADLDADLLDAADLVQDSAPDSDDLSPDTTTDLPADNSDDTPDLLPLEPTCTVGSLPGRCAGTLGCPSGHLSITGHYCEDLSDCCVVDDTEFVGTPCVVQGVAGSCLDLSDCGAGHQATPGYCPGPTAIRCCTPVTLQPACSDVDRPLPNPSDPFEAPHPLCPAGMVPVSTFCIDRYEAHLVEIAADGTARAWSPYFNPGQRRMRAHASAGAIPQGYINADQAAAAYAEAGKRLCTNDEWLRACRGPDNLTYPYGNTRIWGACNDRRSPHPAVEYFGTSDAWIWSQLGHPCINQLPNSLAPAGAYPNCVSADGVFDLMGNLHEWTADPSGTFRGGFYVDTVINGEGCLYRTTAHNRSHWDYSTGFRCCAAQ